MSVIHIIFLTEKMGNQIVGPQCVEQLLSMTEDAKKSRVTEVTGDVLICKPTF